MRWIAKDSGGARKESIGSIVSGLFIIVPLLIPGDTDPYRVYFLLFSLASFAYGAAMFYYSRVLAGREKVIQREADERRALGLS